MKDTSGNSKFYLPRTKDPLFWETVQEGDGREGREQVKMLTALAPS